jgi:hypothetical protein
MPVLIVGLARVPLPRPVPTEPRRCRHSRDSAEKSLCSADEGHGAEWK